MLSRTFCSTCSQSTASADEPGARSIAARARGGDGGVHGLDRNRAFPVEPERDELLDDDAHLLAGDVTEHEVAREARARRRGGERRS